MRMRTGFLLVSAIVLVTSWSTAQAQQRIKEGTAGGGTNPDRLATVVGINSSEAIDAAIITYDQCLTEITSKLGDSWVIGAIGKAHAGVSLGADGERGGTCTAGRVGDTCQIDFDCDTVLGDNSGTCDSDDRVTANLSLTPDRVFNSHRDARSPGASAINLDPKDSSQGWFYAAVGDGDRRDDGAAETGYPLGCCDSTDIVGYRIDLGTNPDLNTVSVTRVFLVTDKALPSPTTTPADDFFNVFVRQNPAQVAPDGTVIGRMDDRDGFETAQHIIWKSNIQDAIDTPATAPFSLNFDNYLLDPGSGGIAAIVGAFISFETAEVTTGPMMDTLDTDFIMATTFSEEFLWTPDCGVTQFEAGGNCTAPASNVGDPCIVNADCDDAGGDGVCTISPAGNTELFNDFLGPLGAGSIGQDDIRGNAQFNSAHRVAAGSRGTGVIHWRDPLDITSGLNVFEVGDTGIIAGPTHRFMTYPNPLAHCDGFSLVDLDGAHYHGAAAFGGSFSALAINSSGHIVSPTDYGAVENDNGADQALIWNDGAVTGTVWGVVAYSGQAWDPTNCFTLDGEGDPNPGTPGDEVAWTLGTNDILAETAMSNPQLDDFDNVFFSTPYDNKRDADDTNNPVGLFRAVFNQDSPPCWTLDLIISDFTSWRDCNNVDVFLSDIRNGGPGGVPSNASINGNSGVGGLLPGAPGSGDGGFDPASPLASGGVVFYGTTLLDETPPSNNLIEVACSDDDDACGGGSSQSSLSVAVSSGVPLFIEVTARNFDGTGGDLDLHLDLGGGGTSNPAILANDECTGALVIPTGGSAFDPANQSTTTATRAESDPLQSCTILADGVTTDGRRNSHSVWYVYVPAANGTLNVNTCGSDYDTVLTVHTGSCGPGSALVNDGIKAKGKGGTVSGFELCVASPSETAGVSVQDTVEVISGSGATVGFYEIIFVSQVGDSIICPTQAGFLLAANAGASTAADVVWQVDDSEFFNQLLYLKPFEKTAVCPDETCDPSEDQCSCPQDCGAPPATEVGLCDDGIDNDCDGLTDAADTVDCGGGPVLAGDDLWITPAGATHDTVVLPSGFFTSAGGGETSDAVNSLVQLEGVPLNSTGGTTGQADTIVRRLADSGLTGCGDSVVIPIEIIALSLQSLAPITVTYPSDPPESWDVFVCLPPPALSQPQGSMTVNQVCQSGGTYTVNNMPVQPRFIFTRQGGGANSPVTEDAVSPLNFTSAGSWSNTDPRVCTAPPVNAGNGCLVNADCDDAGGDGVCVQVGLTTTPGETVDTDCDGTPETSVASSGDFFPGLVSSGCVDCATRAHATFVKRLTLELALLARHGVFIANASKPAAVCVCGDFNAGIPDSTVNLLDFAQFSLCFGGSPATPGCECTDLNQDGAINLFDFATFGLIFGAPAADIVTNCG